jgi:lipoprotein-anchoring transpeptidase ErfK/SrfK
MGTTIMMRNAVAQYKRAFLRAAPLLLVLLVSACATDGATDGATGSRTAHPPAPPAAEKQDIIPTPTGGTPTTPAVTPTAVPKNVPAAPAAKGKVILVSLSQQQLYAYENGRLAFTFLVETGRPELPTPTGVFHVFDKNCSDRRWTSNVAPGAAHNATCDEHTGDGHRAMFTSPWPAESPYWYAPTHINYALKFRDGGYYLHDAWWHEDFGPGSNVPHKISNGDWETGSHGCVGMKPENAEKLYAWTPLGTAVYIRWGV